MGLCGARVVMREMNEGQVVGLCTARAQHEGTHSPEERLSVFYANAVTEALRPAA